MRAVRLLLLPCVVIAASCAPFPGAQDAGTEAGCQYDVPQGCPAVVPSYQNQIAAIVEARCVVCHQPVGPGAEWPLGSWGGISSVSDDALSLVASCKMPEADAGQLTPDERQALLNWLTCGAPDN
jgi:uncharacterized membrane protein